MTAQPWEPRLAHLEGAFEQFEKRVDARFDQVDVRFTQIDARFTQIDSRFDAVDRKIDDVRRLSEAQFRWVIGLIVVSIILPLATRFIAH
jgi:hypothetical protein